MCWTRLWCLYLSILSGFFFEEWGLARPQYISLLIYTSECVAGWLVDYVVDCVWLNLKNRAMHWALIWNMDSLSPKDGSPRNFFFYNVNIISQKLSDVGMFMGVGCSCVGFSNLFPNLFTIHICLLLFTKGRPTRGWAFFFSISLKLRQNGRQTGITKKSGHFLEKKYCEFFSFTCYCYAKIIMVLSFLVFPQLFLKVTKNS